MVQSCLLLGREMSRLLAELRFGNYPKQECCYTSLPSPLWHLSQHHLSTLP